MDAEITREELGDTKMNQFDRFMFQHPVLSGLFGITVMIGTLWFCMAISGRI